MNEMEKAQTYKYVDRKKLMQGLKVDEFRRCDNTLDNQMRQNEKKYLKKLLIHSIKYIAKIKN